MDILEKYEKLWNLGGKYIPDFKLTGPAETILFDDVHWNITKYLGKINGLLNKKLRKLWIQNDGFCVHYATIAYSKPTKEFRKNITEITIGFISSNPDFRLELIASCPRLEKIKITDFGHLHEDVKNIKSLFNIFASDTDKNCPNFQGIFIDRNAYYLQENYCNESNLADIVRNITDKFDYLFISINIFNNSIFYYDQRDTMAQGLIYHPSNTLDYKITDYKIYYDLMSDQSVKFISSKTPEAERIIDKNCKFILTKYVDLKKLFLYFRECPIKKIKVLIVNDPKTLNYYRNVLKPSYDAIGIELELVIIGSIYRSSSLKRDNKNKLNINIIHIDTFDH